MRVASQGSPPAPPLVGEGWSGGREVGTGAQAGPPLPLQKFPAAQGCRPGPGKLWPTGQIGPETELDGKVLLAHREALVCTLSPVGFVQQRQSLSSCSGDCVAHKAENIYFLAPLQALVTRKPKDLCHLPAYLPAPPQVVITGRPRCLNVRNGKGRRRSAHREMVGVSEVSPARGTLRPIKSR